MYVNSFLLLSASVVARKIYCLKVFEVLGLRPVSTECTNTATAML